VLIQQHGVKLESFDSFNGVNPAAPAEKVRNPGVRLIKSTYLPKEKLEEPFPSKESEEIKKQLPK
jgi:hypothetical protein